MFYCEVCRVKNNWPRSISRSRGACEVCDEIGDCYDIASSYLSSPEARWRVSEPVIRASHVKKLEDALDYALTRRGLEFDFDEWQEVFEHQRGIADIHLRAFEEAKSFVDSFLGWKMTEEERFDSTILTFVVGLASEIKKLRALLPKAS